MKRLPWSFLVLVAAFGASLAGLFLALLPAAPSAEADIDNATHLSRKHIARNLVLGEAISICASDYSNALNWAIDLWNDAFHGEHLLDPATDAFRTGCPGSTGTVRDRIEFVSVEARTPSDPEFYCTVKRNPSTGFVATANGCVLIPPRTYNPLNTYAGHLRVIMNADTRPPSADSATTSADSMHEQYQLVRRTLAHELGHVLGLKDYQCGTVVDAMMLCTTTAKEHYETWQEIRPTDLTDYSSAYRPNLVRQDSRGNDFVENVAGLPSSIVFRFDASNVGVERSIEIRRKDGGIWRGVLKSFGPETGEVSWVLNGQPTGEQTYGIFSTTAAYLFGQAQGQDSLDPTRTVPAGFVKEVTIDVGATPGVSGEFTIDVSVLGDGRVAKVRDGTTYFLNESVELEAIPSERTWTRTTSMGTITERTTVTRFAGWDGACRSDVGATSSPTDTTCQLAMDSNKRVTATFEPITHTLTTTAEVGGTVHSDLSVSPSHPSGQAYNAGTVVTVSARKRVVLGGTDTSGGTEYNFVRWDGDCSVVGGSDPLSLCLLFMDENQEVSAVYAPSSDIQCRLKVEAHPEEGGLVSGSGTVDCGDTLTARVTATNHGYEFTSWSGGGCSGTGNCTVTVGTLGNFEEVVVTANFTPTAPPAQCTLTVTINPLNGGSVSGVGNGQFVCGATTTLRAIANSDYAFAGWSGGCSGTGSCDVVVGSTGGPATTVRVTASFSVVAPPTPIPDPTHRVQLDVSPASCGNVDWKSIDGITPEITWEMIPSPWDVPHNRTIRSMAPADGAVWAPGSSETCRFSHWDEDCIRKVRHTCDLVVTGPRRATAYYTISGSDVPNVELTLSVTPSACGDITWRLVRQAFGSTTAPSQAAGTNTVSVARGTVLAITAPANTSSCRFLSWGSGVCENQGRHCQAGIGGASTAAATYGSTASSARGEESTTPHSYSLFGEGPYSWVATCHTGSSTGFGTNLETDTLADADARQWIRDNCWASVPIQKR